MRTLFVLAVLCSQFGCTSTAPVPAIGGDLVTIQMRGEDQQLEGELLLVTRDSVFLGMDAALIGFGLPEVSGIVLRDRRSFWRKAGIGGAALASGALAAMILREEENDPGFGLIGAAALSVSVYGLVTQGPVKYQYKAPFYVTDLQRLRRYARFPAGVSTERLRRLYAMKSTRRPAS